MKQKIYKLCSVLLTLALVLSTCICAIGTVSAANVATYYVSPDGVDTNDGLTATTPVASVEKAVTLANTAGYGAGDTVYVKVIHVADKSTTWAAAAQITAHAFTLDLSSNGDIAQVGAVDSAMTFNGPTKLSNIKMMWGRSSSDKGYPAVNFAGNDVVIGNGISTYNGEYNLYYARSDTFDKDLYLTFKGPFTKQMFMGGDWGGPTLNKNVYINFEGTGSYDFRVGTSNGNNAAGAHATKVNAAVNINLKSGTPKLTFVSNAYKMRYGENSAIQVINSVGVATNDWVTALTTTEDNTSKPAKYYIVNNKSGLPKAVQFTDTVGKFNVSLSNAWTITVTDKDGNPVDAAVENGVLDFTALASGVYNIEATKTATEELTYYVSPNGDDTAAGTEAAPLATINGAIAAAQDYGLATNDTLNVKVVYVEGASALINAESTNAIASHAFALNVTSAGDQIASLGNKKGLALGGNTTFDNINLQIKGSTDVRLDIGDNDLYIGETVSFTGDTKLGVGLTNTYKHDFTKPHTIYIGSKDWTTTRQGEWGMPLLNNPYTIIFDNGGSNDFNMAGYGRAGQFNSKMTFDIRNAATFTLRAVRSAEDPNTPYQISDNAVFELMNNSNADVSAAIEFIKGLKTTAGAAVPYYTYDNKTGIKNAIELTDTLGKVKVNVDAQRFQLLVNGEVAEIVEGYVTLPAGDYDFTVKLIAPFDDTYYVKTGATEGNGTEAAPFATVAEAIAAANAKGSIYGDNIAIKLVGEEAVVWGESEVFFFVPVVESANKEALTAIIIDGGSIKGSVVLDYVIVDTTLAPTGEGFKRLFVNGNNIKLGENVQGNIEFVAAAQSGNYASGQTVEINTAAVKNIYVGNTTQNHITFKGDVNYVLNNAELSTRFNLMPYYGREININGNFNIKAVAAKSITIGKATIDDGDGGVMAGRVNITGEGNGATLIAPVGTTVDGLDQFALITDNYYVIKTGIFVDINVTEFVGEYEFDYDETIHNLVVTDAEGNVLVAEEDYSHDDGILLFFAPGEYTVELKCIVHVYDFECDNTCNRCEEVDETRAHKFTDVADATCDYGCGFVRPRGPQLVEEDGVTYYYYNGVKSTATGLVEYNGKTMYINKGRFLGASGLVTIDGKKLYIRNGYFLGASGLVTIGGKKLYIRNGYFLGASGLVTIDGNKVYIRNGYFLGATGLVTIGGKKLYIRNGYFLGATGIVTLDGKKLYIRNGYFLGASGTVTVGGKKYKVVKGIVQ